MRSVTDNQVFRLLLEVFGPTKLLFVVFLLADLLVGARIKLSLYAIGNNPADIFPVLLEYGVMIVMSTMISICQETAANRLMLGVDSNVRKNYWQAYARWRFPDRKKVTAHAYTREVEGMIDTFTEAAASYTWMSAQLVDSITSVVVLAWAGYFRLVIGITIFYVTAYWTVFTPMLARSKTMRKTVNAETMANNVKRDHAHGEFEKQGKWENFHKFSMIDLLLNYTRQVEGSMFWYVIRLSSKITTGAFLLFWYYCTEQNTGELLFAVNLLGSIAFTVGQLGRGYDKWVKCETELMKVEKMRNDERSLDVAKYALPDDDFLVRIRLTRERNGKKFVMETEFWISKFTTFRGESGCGKSTLVMLLMNELPGAAWIVIAGEEIPIAHFSHEIATSDQSSTVPAGPSLAETLGLLDEHGDIDPYRREIAVELLDRFGLTSWFESHTSTAPQKDHGIPMTDVIENGTAWSFAKQIGLDLAMYFRYRPRSTDDVESVPPRCDRFHSPTIETSGGEGRRLRIIICLIEAIVEGKKMVVIDEPEVGLRSDEIRVSFGAVFDYLRQFDMKIVLMTHASRIDLMIALKQEYSEYVVVKTNERSNVVDAATRKTMLLKEMAVIERLLEEC